MTSQTFTVSIEAIDTQQNLPKILVSAPVETVTDLQTALQHATPYLNSTSLVQIFLQTQNLTYNVHKTYFNTAVSTIDDGSFRAFVYIFNPDNVDPGYVSNDPNYAGDPNDEYFIYTGQGTTCKKHETIHWQLAIQGMEHFLLNTNQPRSPAIQWKMV